MGSKTIETVSLILGWIYVICWTISFYPQVYLNYKRKSVTGLSIDFVVASVIGFVCYSIYTISFFAVPLIQQEYRDAHDGKDNLVQINDVVFAVHALAITIVYLAQKKDENMSKLGVAGTIGFGIFFVALVSLCMAKIISWLNFVYVMSYLKLITTILKYIPQVYMNYVMKSTVGWHIQNVILDFTGGILSIAQLILDAFNMDDLSGIKGTSAKLILGFVSIIFDIIFFLQHYVWYPETGHQRTVVEIGKSSELASPIPKNTDNMKNLSFDSPIQKISDDIRKTPSPNHDKNPKELEAQKNGAERMIY